MSGFAWDWAYAIACIPHLLEGLKITVLVTACGFVIALVLGFALVFLRIARIPVVSPATAVFIEFIRGTPFLIQLFFLFYVVPNWGLTLSAIVTGIVAIGIFNSAYVSEIYRAGIEDIAPGQWEACLTLGLPVHHVWLRIIIPQAFVAVLPMLGNVVVGMFKETAVLSTITVMEMLARGVDLGSTHFRYIEPLTLVGAMYLVISLAAARAIRRLEHKRDVSSI